MTPIRKTCLSPSIPVAIIGAGRIGRLHARHLARDVAGARIVAIADADLAAAERLAVELSVPTCVADYRRLFDEPTVEAVVICTPVESHTAIVTEAAQAGRHVFCEKPLGFELARIDEALSAVKQAGVKLQVGFNRRFDPDFLAVREAIEAGRVGTPELLRITSRDPAPPPLDYIKSSGGIFLDMAIHDCDMARFLVGDEVTRVFAAASVLVDPQIGEAGDYDTAVTNLAFRGGALALIDNSRRAAYGYDQRVELLGSAGMVAATNRPTVACRIHDTAGMHTANPTVDTMGRYLQAYRRELAAFIDCIQQDTAPPVSGYDGRQATMLALAAAESVRKGRPVDIEEIESMPPAPGAANERSSHS